MTTEATSEALDSSSTPEVVVETSYAVPLQKLWNTIISPEGEQALLGEGASLGEKGENWEASDGHFGVMRSFHPGEQLRFSWHASAGDPATLVELNLADEGDSTHCEIKHSKLPAGADTAALREHWEKVLDRLDGMVK